MPRKILMCYPNLGFAGNFVVNVPVSLIYAVREVVKNPEVEVELVDCRIDENWKDLIAQKLLNDDVLLVGISVMSGIPVEGAFEISRIVKENSNVPVVWGGAHPTILPEDTLEYGNVDYCIRGFGSESLAKLVEFLLYKEVDIASIEGLCYQKGGVKHIGRVNDRFEMAHFSELPYYLLDSRIEEYFNTQKNRVFPIYTALGCPYQCSFCISPIMYKDVKKKWIPLDAVSVVDHIEFLQETYGVNYIYFYDDDTFVKFSHFGRIAQELMSRKIKVTLGVRGIRVNELKKMKDDDFNLLMQSGVKNLHVGLESGSQRMLDVMKKGIKVEDSLYINRRLAKYEQLLPMYNLLVGIPGETIEDLIDTGKLMLRLAKENPRCIIFDPGKLIPYPGSELYELSVEFGFVPPKVPKDWVTLDQEGDIKFPWYSDAYDRQIKMLQVTSYALSNWEEYLKDYPFYISFIFNTAKTLYKPIAFFRLKTGWSYFLIEYWLYKKLSYILAG